MKLSPLLTLVAVIIDATLGIIFGKHIYIFLTRWVSNALDHHGALNRIVKPPDMDLFVWYCLCMFIGDCILLLTARMNWDLSLTLKFVIPVYAMDKEIIVFNLKIQSVLSFGVNKILFILQKIPFESNLYCITWWYNFKKICLKIDTFPNFYTFISLMWNNAVCIYHLKWEKWNM